MKAKYSGYLRWAITAVCSVSVCLVIFFLLFRSAELGRFLGKLGNILSPLIIGSVIAYLLNPIVNFFDRILTKLFLRINLSAKRAQNLSLYLSVFLSLSIFLFCVYFLISLILPELYQNVKNFASNFDDYIDIITDWFSNLKIFEDNPALYSNLSSTLDKMLHSIEEWLSTSLLTSLSDILSGLTFRIIGIFNVVFDLAVGLIISVYILLSKRKYVAKVKRFAYVIFKPENANTALRMATKCNSIFSGFISGKLLDSLIIGMLCFICMTIFNMPYAILISVIVGVTNIIPFFGPFIGAIPSALLILLSDPTDFKQVIVFAIFILCLQQFDGNILGPKILGDSTGTSALMVVVSISIGGGFFGFMGMLLGVPTFAVLSYLFKCFIHYCLKKKGLPPGHANYVDLTSIDAANGQLHYCTPATSSLTGVPVEYTKSLSELTANQPTFSETVQETEIESSEKVEEKKEKEKKKRNKNKAKADSQSK